MQTGKGKGEEEGEGVNAFVHPTSMCVHLSSNGMGGVLIYWVWCFAALFLWDGCMYVYV